MEWKEGRKETRDGSTRAAQHQEQGMDGELISCVGAGKQVPGRSTLHSFPPPVLQVLSMLSKQMERAVDEDISLTAEFILEVAR